MICRRDEILSGSSSNPANCAGKNCVSDAELAILQKRYKLVTSITRCLTELAEVHQLFLNGEDHRQDIVELLKDLAEDVEELFKDFHSSDPMLPKYERLARMAREAQRIIGDSLQQ